MPLKIDLWFLARVAKCIRYVDRYSAKPGRHRPEVIFSS